MRSVSGTRVDRTCHDPDVPTLADAVRATWSRWPGFEPAVERAVFGTADADEVAAAVERFCEHALGAPVAAGLFYEVSVTCVAGVELVDGRQVVVRVAQPNRTEAFLGAVVGAQRHLFDEGFPAPEPLLGPTRFEGRLHTVEAVVDDPGTPDGWDPAVRAAGIDGLRRCVDLLRGVPFDVEHPQAAKPGVLYPTPHSPLFSFDRPEPDIDELARTATRIRDAHESPGVLAHADWTVRNVRVVDGRLHVAYDWDSLAVVPEHLLVGQVGMTFGSWGDGEGRPPTPDELGAFVEAYGGVDERAARAAGLYLACYVARCERSLGRSSGGFDAALRRWGEAYLG